MASHIDSGTVPVIEVLPKSSVLSVTMPGPKDVGIVPTIEPEALKYESVDMSPRADGIVPESPEIVLRSIL